MITQELNIQIARGIAGQLKFESQDEFYDDMIVELPIGTLHVDVQIACVQWFDGATYSQPGEGGISSLYFNSIQADIVDLDGNCLSVELDDRVIETELMLMVS